MFGFVYAGKLVAQIQILDIFFASMKIIDLNVSPYCMFLLDIKFKLGLTHLLLVTNLVQVKLPQLKFFTLLLFPKLFILLFFIQSIFEC